MLNEIKTPTCESDVNMFEYGSSLSDANANGQEDKWNQNYENKCDSNREEFWKWYWSTC